MLAKQLAIGSTPGSLVTYLFGAGRANEHTDQRLIAGSAGVMTTFGAVDVAADREAQGALAREFDGAWRQVRRERGLPLEVPEGEQQRGAARGDRVYHATLSLSADEGALSDEEWARAARMFVVEMGFVDSKDGVADCAWMAVHHGASKEGNDHLHIAVNLVREDGRRASIHQSKRRTAQAGARVAGAMGKDIAFDPEVSSGIGNIPRAELERARREQRDADRVLIRRRLAGAAWQASNEAEFVRAARASGVILRPRYAEGAMVRVVGYSAALDHGGKAVWFAPSKLDRSLGLPVLRERYGWGLDAQMQAVSVWRERAGAKQPGVAGLRLPVADEIKRVRSALVRSNPGVSWRQASTDLSAMLGQWSVQAEGGRGGHLARASDALSRASQPRRGTPREATIEAARTVIDVMAAASKDDTVATLALIMQAMQLAESVARCADAERELQAARKVYEDAVLPLNIEGGDRRSEEFLARLAELDEESLQVMRDTAQLPREGLPERRPGKVDWSRLQPETRAALGHSAPSTGYSRVTVPVGTTAVPTYRQSGRGWGAEREHGYGR